MKILFEDKNVVACCKAPGLLSEISPDKPSLANEIYKAYGYAGIIHRLDTNVGGAILYAKNKKSAAAFSKIVAEGGLFKEYLAVVEGRPLDNSGTFCDLLFKDSSKNKVFVVKRERKGVKKAVLDYSLLQSVNHDGKILSLVKIKLHTGRSHQIRVQFSSRKMPLTGDGKYGSKNNKCDVALWSYHIYSEKTENCPKIDVISNPPADAYPWSLFNFLFLT